MHPGLQAVNLEAYGPLRGAGDIVQVPGVHDALVHDLTFVAAAMLQGPSSIS